MPFATLMTCHDPYHPMKGREVTFLEGAGPLSACAPETDKPFILMRNGEAVLRKDWGLPVERGDIVTCVMLPQGGGGGSNPLKFIAMIVVMYFTAGMGAGFIGAAEGSLAAAAANAAVSMIGAASVDRELKTGKGKQ